MANVPPQYFYNLSQPKQEEFAIKRMQEAYALGDQWKALSVQARKKHIPEPEIDRPDEDLLKNPVN